MSILIHTQGFWISKIVHKRGGGQKCLKTFRIVYGWPKKTHFTAECCFVNETYKNCSRINSFTALLLLYVLNKRVPIVTALFSSEYICYHFFGFLAFLALLFCYFLNRIWQLFWSSSLAAIINLSEYWVCTIIVCMLFGWYLILLK